MSVVLKNARVPVPVSLGVSLITLASALLLFLVPANEVSADRQWDINTSTDCYSGLTKGGVGVDCGTYFYLSGNSTTFFGRTDTRADEDVGEIYARNFGAEWCNAKVPRYVWDEDMEDENDDYVSASGWASVTQSGCAPNGSLNTHGLSDWHSGSAESSSQSLEHHPKATHS